MLCPLPDTCIYSERKRYGADMCGMPECVVTKRNRVYYERLNLQRKPYLTIAERARLADLNLEWNRLMLCGDMVRRNV